MVRRLSQKDYADCFFCSDVMPENSPVKMSSSRVLTIMGLSIRMAHCEALYYDHEEEGLELMAVRKKGEGYCRMKDTSNRSKTIMAGRHRSNHVTPKALMKWVAKKEGWKSLSNRYDRAMIWANGILIEATKHGARSLPAPVETQLWYASGRGVAWVKETVLPATNDLPPLVHPISRVNLSSYDGYYLANTEQGWFRTVPRDRRSNEKERWRRAFPEEAAKPTVDIAEHQCGVCKKEHNEVFCPKCRMPNIYLVEKPLCCATIAYLSYNSGFRVVTDGVHACIGDELTPDKVPLSPLVIHPDIVGRLVNNMNDVKPFIVGEGHYGKE